MKYHPNTPNAPWKHTVNNQPPPQMPVRTDFTISELSGPLGLHGLATRAVLVGSVHTKTRKLGFNPTWVTVLKVLIVLF